MVGLECVWDLETPSHAAQYSHVVEHEGPAGEGGPREGPGGGAEAGRAENGGGEDLLGAEEKGKGGEGEGGGGDSSEGSWRDKDGDGEISLEEYLDSELKDIDEDDTIETVALGYAMAHFMFQMMDEGMGNSDSSGTLSADEFASLYKNLDQFTVTKVGEEYQGNLTGVFDGKIDILSSSEEFLWYLIDGTNNQENINQLYEMYLEALNQ